MTVLVRRIRGILDGWSASAAGPSCWAARHVVGEHSTLTSRWIC